MRRGVQLASITFSCTARKCMRSDCRRGIYPPKQPQKRIVNPALSNKRDFRSYLTIFFHYFKAKNVGKYCGCND